MKKITMGLVFSLLLLFIVSSAAYAQEQLVIVFHDGTSQTFTLDRPVYSIRSINFQGPLTSGANDRIIVVAGTYGKNCNAGYGNKTDHLARSCNDRKRCEYIIDYQVIGDPAVGCGKDYIAEWRCGNDSTIHRTSASPEAGFRKQIILSCPR
jgi:hypothetical protein